MSTKDIHNQAVGEELLDEAVYENTNGVPLCDGKNLHMDVGQGEIANRIITVGSVGRAEIIAAAFDKSPALKTIVSPRGFTTISGYYKGTYVSAVAIGMGPSMMDFFVRETRAVTTGPLAVIRFGTCGGIADDPPGSIVVSSKGSGYALRNPDAFAANYKYPEPAATSFWDPLGVGNYVMDLMPKPSPYTFYKVAPVDQQLSAILKNELTKELGEEIVSEGGNVTAESFYGTQGRIDPNFDDQNDTIIELIKAEYPEAKTLEMETFMLLHLSSCSKVPIYSSAAAIVVASRSTAKVIEGKTLEHLERRGGVAMLEAITKMELPGL